MNFIKSNELVEFNSEQKNIILGVRPEKMVCGGEIRFSAPVDMYELLGSEKIVYFTIGESKCSAKLPADYEIKKTIDLSIRKEDIYYFDCETGKRI